MWRWLLLLVILGNLVLGIAAGVLNPQPLTLDLFVTRIDTPLGMLVVGVFACGVLVGALLAGLIGRTRRARQTAATTGAEVSRDLSQKHD